MTKLRCAKCDFQWTSKTGMIPMRCPYCGKERQIEDTEVKSEFIDVDELLK